MSCNGGFKRTLRAPSKRGICAARYSRESGRWPTRRSAIPPCRSTTSASARPSRIFRSLGSAAPNPRRSSCKGFKVPQPLTGVMKRVLLLLPTTSYRNEAFLAAGRKLDVEIITVADYCHQLAPSWGLDPIMAVHFDQPGEALEDVLRSLKHQPDAVLAVDDPGLELAARLNERLSL